MIKVKSTATTTKEITGIYVKTGASTTKSIGEVYQVYSSGGTKALIKVFGAVLGVQAPTVSSVTDDGETVYVTAVAKNANDTIEYRFTEYSIEGTCSYESEWSTNPTLGMYSCTNEVCVEVRSVRNNETSDIVTVTHYPDREAYHSLDYYINYSLVKDGGDDSFHVAGCGNGNCGYVDTNNLYTCAHETIVKPTCTEDGYSMCTGSSEGNPLGTEVGCGHTWVIPATGCGTNGYSYTSYGLINGGWGTHAVYCADCSTHLYDEYCGGDDSNGGLCPLCGETNA